MREIKFRAYHQKLKKMKPVIKLELRTTEICVGEKEWWLTNYATLMQYTGLKDKNGKEIYEGDIIRFRESIAKVEWRGVGFDINYWKDDFSDNVMWANFSLLYWEDSEVIGNIYENPELMEER